MTWQIINAEPAYGVCDQCKQHECGIVDGEHKWIMTGIYDRSGDAIVIGYKCVELWANNLGISRQVVEREVRTAPTQEEIGAYLRNLLSNSTDDPIKTAYQQNIVGIPNDRDELKAWLSERDIPFQANWGDKRLRETAEAHLAAKGSGDET